MIFLLPCLWNLKFLLPTRLVYLLTAAPYFANTLSDSNGRALREALFCTHAHVFLLHNSVLVYLFSHPSLSTSLSFRCTSGLRICYHNQEWVPRFDSNPASPLRRHSTFNIQPLYCRALSYHVNPLPFLFHSHSSHMSVSSRHFGFTPFLDAPHTNEHLLHSVVGLPTRVQS